MKIVIVTVYNSENSGSFLQAYALEQVLSSMGHDVRFLRRELKGTSHKLFGKLRIKEIVKSVLKANIRDVYISLRRWYLYEKIIKHFSVCDINSDFYNETTLFVLGSDTIWNFDDDYFLSKASLLTGYNLPEKKVITYAASAANTSEDFFLKVISKNGNLHNIVEILVRDSHTADLVNKVSSKPAKLVCDPTFLCNPSLYDSFSAKINISKPYLLLYYGGAIDLSLQNTLKDYAKKNDLDVISLISYYKWCTKTYFGAPQYFIPLFKNATAVFTNTFHGCAFSLIYNKRFAVKDDNKNKVTGLLTEYGVEDHLFRSEKDFENCINIRWREATSHKMKLKKEESLKHLSDSL